MKLEGTYNFEASREVVWDMLQDPEVISSIIPGSEAHAGNRRQQISVGAEYQGWPGEWSF